MVKFKRVWAVHRGDTDTRNGTPRYFFSTEEAARNNAHRNGWYGSDAPMYLRFAVEIDGETYLLDNHGEPIDLDGEKAKRRQECRDQALAKLTQEEREALGV